MPDTQQTFTERRDGDELFNVKEAANYLRLKRSTLDHYRCEGRGPIYRKHGARVFYTRKSLDDWSNRNAFVSTSERVKPEE